MKFFEQLSTKKIHLIKLSGSGNQKVLEKYLGMNAGLWSSVCVWSSDEVV